MSTRGIGLALMTVAALACAWVPAVQAKRAAPAHVAPVEHDGVRYVVKHWASESGLAHNGGFVEAQDVASGRKLWGVEVYSVTYDPSRERDVQDVFIVSLRLDAAGRRLVVQDERGETYWVDLASHAVTRPPASP